MVSKEAAFWDTSALVPLCLDERISRQAHSYARSYTLVVWWATLVEVSSAIARAHRSGRLTEPERRGALSRLGLVSRSWREISPSDELRDLAVRLLDTHELRAGDSLQLAAALTWCDERPARRSFVCADRRLSHAAASAGFSVLELSRSIV